MNLRCAEQVAGTHVTRTLLRTLLGKRALGRPRRSRKDVINIDVGLWGWKINRNGARLCPVADFDISNF